MQACAKQLINDNQNPSSFQLRDIILTMNLHGDPAVKLNNHLQPDYYIDKHQIYFEPEEISVDLNSFDMNIIIHNLGKATDENFKLYIERTFEGGIDTMLLNIDPIYHKDTVTITFPMEANAAGLNQFKVFVDWTQYEGEGGIEEISETNNSINFPTKDLWIESTDLVPLYPYDYAIVPDKEIKLIAMTAEKAALNKSYVIQIDTTDTYNSLKIGRAHV